MLKIEDAFSFNNHDKIVVGCSTGPDSMALVDMLLKIRDKYQLSIIIAHVNHNVRKESFEEAKFLEEYCAKNNLIFETMIIENYGDDNFHNEARFIRYNFFENIVHKYEANYLMTAHHGDDLIETVLKEEPDVHLKFLKFSKSLDEASKFIIKSRNKALNRVLENDKVLIDKFLLEDDYLQKEILYYLLNDFYQDDLILVNDKHIDLMMKLIKSTKANSYVNLPNEVLAKKDYNYFEIVRETDVITGYEIEFDNYVTLPNNHSIEKIEKTEDNSNNICRLNSEDITLPLIVRTRKIGDKIQVKGLGGTKKLKDIFIDKKISLANRDIWPIVSDSTGKIVWIPGLKKSIFDKKKTERYDIILKYK